LNFCFVVVVFLLFVKKKHQQKSTKTTSTHYLSQSFAIPFSMLNYLVKINKGYKDTDLAYLSSLPNNTKTPQLSVMNGWYQFV